MQRLHNISKLEKSKSFQEHKVNNINAWNSLSLEMKLEKTTQDHANALQELDKKWQSLNQNVDEKVFRFRQLKRLIVERSRRELVRIDEEIEAQKKKKKDFESVRSKTIAKWKVEYDNFCTKLIGLHQTKLANSKNNTLNSSCTTAAGMTEQLRSVDCSSLSEARLTSSFAVCRPQQSFPFESEHHHQHFQQRQRPSILCSVDCSPSTETSARSSLIVYPPSPNPPVLFQPEEQSQVQLQQQPLHLAQPFYQIAQQQQLHPEHEQQQFEQQQQNQGQQIQPEQQHLHQEQQLPGQQQYQIQRMNQVGLPSVQKPVLTNDANPSKLGFANFKLNHHQADDNIRSTTPSFETASNASTSNECQSESSICNTSGISGNNEAKENLASNSTTVPRTRGRPRKDQAASSTVSSPLHVNNPHNLKPCKKTRGMEQADAIDQNLHSKFGTRAELSSSTTRPSTSSTTRTSDLVGNGKHQLTANVDRPEVATKSNAASTFEIANKKDSSKSTTATTSSSSSTTRTTTRTVDGAQNQSQVDGPAAQQSQMLQNKPTYQMPKIAIRSAFLKKANNAGSTTTKEEEEEDSNQIETKPRPIFLLHSWPPSSSYSGPTTTGKTDLVDSEDDDKTRVVPTSASLPSDCDIAIIE